MVILVSLLIFLLFPPSLYAEYIGGGSIEVSDIADGALPIHDTRDFAGASLDVRTTTCFASHKLCDARGETGTLEFNSALTVGDGKTLLLPASPITFNASLTVHQGAHLVCSGASLSNSGTLLKAGTGLNAPVLIARNSAGAGEWWHAASIQNCKVDGNKANQTINADVVVVDRLAEASFIHNLYITDGSEDNLQLNGNVAGSGSLQNISSFSADGHGFHVAGATGGLDCYNCKGDDNAGGLWLVSGATGGHLRITGGGGESKVAATNDPVIDFDSATGGELSVTLSGWTTVGPNAVTDFLKITDWPAGKLAVNCDSCRIYSGTTNLVNDAVNAYTVPNDATARQMARWTYAMGDQVRYFKRGSFVLDGQMRIGSFTSTTPGPKIDVDRGTGFGDLRLDGSSGGCLMIRDTDDAGWTKCTVLNGTMTCTTDADGVC